MQRHTLLAGCLLAVTSIWSVPTSAMHIACGKSFVPCESSGSDATVGRPRSFGIPNARYHHQQIAEPLVRAMTKEAMDEVQSLTSARGVRHLAAGFRDTTPLNNALRQFDHIHPVPEIAANVSEAAYVATMVAKKLRNFGLRETDIALGLSAKSIENTGLGKICPDFGAESCSMTEFRSLSGACNNVQHPMWGSVFQPLTRIDRVCYADGVSTARVSRVGTSLPNPRKVSLEVFAAKGAPHEHVSELTPYWLAFIASDVAQLGFASELPCCEDNFTHPECIPIKLDSTDSHYQDLRVSCLPMTRSLPSPRKHCQLGSREQANFASSYLDASGIYGTTISRLNALRSGARGGMLQTYHFGAELLPHDPASFTYCQSALKNKCFLTGSNDANVLPEISVFHLLFVKEHNRLARTLKQLNPHWNEERIFQEARKIVIGEIQHITYSEFLPVLLGQQGIKKYKLNVRNDGHSANYDSSVDATALNSFATLATTVAFSLLGAPKTPFGAKFNNPDSLYEPHGVGSLLSQLLRIPASEPGLHLDPDFRGKFLRGHFANIGLDLAAMTLQREREHGLPTYLQMRTACDITPKILSFRDLSSQLIDPQVVSTIAKVYPYVEDVDLLVGILAEKPLKGALFGPTLTCILGQQFSKLRTGDRYFYENFFAGSAFTPDQLAQIRSVSFARLVCDHGGPSVNRVQLNSFLLADNFDNYPVSCDSQLVRSMDLTAWKDGSNDLTMPISEATIEKVFKLAELNLEEQSRREGSNIKKNQREFQKGDPLFQYGSMMRAKPESKSVSKLSALLLESTKILLRGGSLPDGEILPSLDIESLQKILLPRINPSTFIGNFTAFLSEDGQSTVDDCLPRDLPCDHTSPFRSFSGWCNNLKNPGFGNAFTPLKHLMSPVYDDGFDAPRSRAVSGGLLPNARQISNAVHFDVNATHVKFTHMVMQFGQLIDHELTHSPVSRGPNDEILNCSRCDSPQTISVHCMPLRVEAGDPFFPTTDVNGEPKCLSFARSLLGQLNLGYRNQLNQLTAFIDGSVVYGSTLCEANTLRLFQRGLMNFTDLYGDLDQVTLPQGNQEKDCRSLPSHPCFVAGDERNSHQPGLTVMHTLFIREHNRLATALGKINPHWNDERLFQEARRIHVAQLQHIVFSEFLPKLIGLDILHDYDLVTLKSGYYEGYDDSCDAAISHPFATAAYRFGHTLVRQMFPRMDFNYRQTTSPIDLSQHFGHVEPLYNTSAGGLDTILMGLLGTPSMAFDRHISGAIRNNLFAKRGLAKSGMDLIALNILRARDHGVQSYNSFRDLCGKPKAKRFTDLLADMDAEAVAALQSIYEDVNDIDLFPGITSERPAKGALLGPTMSCLLAEQFKRLKKCDRFYYENSNAAARFNPSQLQEIRKMTLAKILCQTSKYLRTIQPHVFDMPDDLMNAQVACKDFDRINLEFWRETPYCQINGIRINAGQTSNVTPCVTCTCTGEGLECHPIRVFDCEKLLAKYTLREIQRDTSCVIQCSEMIYSKEHPAPK